MPNVYSLNRSLGLAIAAIAVVALLSSALVLATLDTLRGATRARERSYQIISNLDAFRAAMLNQETALRGI